MAGEEKRKPGGRERPYLELRVVAKVYSILAPIVGGVLLFIGVFVLWFTEEPLFRRLLTGVLTIVGAAAYYFILKAASQVIYILFDIARYARETKEALERPAE